MTLSNWLKRQIVSAKRRLEDISKERLDIIKRKYRKA